MEALISERETRRHRGCLAGGRAWAAGQAGGTEASHTEQRPSDRPARRPVDWGGGLPGEGCHARHGPAGTQPCVAQGAPVFEPPAVTILGGPLCHVTSADRRSFQPMQSHPGPAAVALPESAKGAQRARDATLPLGEAGAGCVSRCFGPTLMRIATITPSPTPLTACSKAPEATRTRGTIMAAAFLRVRFAWAAADRRNLRRSLSRISTERGHWPMSPARLRWGRAFPGARLIARLAIGFLDSCSKPVGRPKCRSLSTAACA